MQNNLKNIANYYLNMPEDIPTDGVLFLTTIFSKMAQMFSEINFIYINSMKTKRAQIDHQLYQNQSTVSPPNQNLEQAKHCLSNLLQKTKQKQLMPKHPQIETNFIKKQSLCEASVSICNVAPPHPPPSSYILFFQDHRQKIQKQYPESSISQLSKIASQCWKQLSQQEKKPYHDKFNLQKLKYYEAMKVYNKSRDNLNRNKKESKLAKKKIPTSKEVKIGKKKEQRQMNKSQFSDDCSDIMI